MILDISFNSHTFICHFEAWKKGPRKIDPDKKIQKVSTLIINFYIYRCTARIITIVFSLVAEDNKRLYLCMNPHVFEQLENHKLSCINKILILFIFIQIRKN